MELEKTTLALAIANMIEYDGIIHSPSFLYINNQTRNIEDKKISDGENAIHILHLALNHEARLIIIDELLDRISQENLNDTLKQIKNSNKIFLIISHKNEIIKEMDITYTLCEKNGSIILQ